MNRWIVALKKRLWPCSLMYRSQGHSFPLGLTVAVFECANDSTALNNLLQWDSASEIMLCPSFPHTVIKFHPMTETYFVKSRSNIHFSNFVFYHVFLEHVLSSSPHFTSH